MKNKIIKVALYLFLPMLILSCSSNDDSECSPKQGNLHTSINGEIDFNPLLVSYGESGGVLSLGAVQMEDDCSVDVSLSFIIEKETNRQELHKHNSSRPFVTATTLFTEWNDDTILGTWELYESEEAWIEIDILEDKTMEGKFQATYLHERNPNDSNSLPDTLRFNNVSFKAEFIVFSDD